MFSYRNHISFPDLFKSEMLSRICALKDLVLKVGAGLAKELFSKFWDYQEGGLGAPLLPELVWGE